MKKSKFNSFTIIMMLLVGLLLLTGCGKDSSNPEAGGNDDEINLLTGDTGGTYYVLGAAIADLVDKKNDDYVTSPQSTGGALNNIPLMGDQDGDVAFGMLGVTLAAYNGDDSIYENVDKEYDDLRFVWGLYEMPMNVVVLEDSGIENMEDLKGKKIASSPGATIMQSPLTLSYAGLEDGDYELVPLGFKAATEALRDGKVDAIHLYLGEPNPSLTDLASQVDVKFLSYGDETLEELLESESYLLPHTIPAGTYKGQDEPVNTFSEQVFLFSHKDVPEEKVYSVVKTIANNIEDLGASHSTGYDATIENNEMYFENPPFPLHKGAEKFIEEISEK